MMAMVRCNFSDVGRITDGVIGRLQREISSTVVLKPGEMNIFGVVNKLRSDNGKGKRLLVVEQGESLSPQLLNGLFYCLSTVSSSIIVLLCLRMSTKRATFFSAMSRRVLASLDVRCYSISSSDEVFDRLASAVLLNPTFTNLKIEPTFARFLRYWTQSLKQMSNEELSQLLKHKGIAKYDIELDPISFDGEASE
ncbi:hypothetical protein OSTOST_15946, partial [Ostertagia ostertagi]